jgi:transcriptional regulator with XRE-family HTH domain
LARSADKEGKGDENPVARRFAETLLRLREAADLTQEELALRAGIHRTQVSLLEAGRRLPRFETLLRISASLGVSPRAFTDQAAHTDGAAGSGVPDRPVDLSTRSDPRSTSAAGSGEEDGKEDGDPVAERFAATLVRLREEAGLSQGELALIAGIYGSQVSLLESGRRLPGYQMLLKLSAGLGVSAQVFYEGIAYVPAVRLGGTIEIDPPVAPPSKANSPVRPPATTNRKSPI